MLLSRLNCTRQDENMDNVKNVEQIHLGYLDQIISLLHAYGMLCHGKIVI